MNKKMDHELCCNNGKLTDDEKAEACEKITWFKRNVLPYIEHNSPSPLTRNWMQNIEKNVDRMEKANQRQNDKNEKILSQIFVLIRDNTPPYTKDELDGKFKKVDEEVNKKANKWVERDINKAKNYMIATCVIMVAAIILSSPLAEKFS